MTYREHFEKAKSDGHEWAEAAIRNTYKEVIDESPTFESQLDGVIAGAFLWASSPEGQKYWEGICKKLKKRPAGTGRI